MNRNILLNDRLNYIHQLLTTMKKEDIKLYVNNPCIDGHTLLTTMIVTFAPLKHEVKVKDLL